jgi:hypothetical protein
VKLPIVNVMGRDGRRAVRVSAAEAARIREFHQTVCAQLGLPGDSNAEVVYAACCEARQRLMVRSMVTEACGLAASATDDEILAVIEAAKARKAATAVQLHAADKQAVDVAVAYAQGGVVAELRRAGIVITPPIEAAAPALPAPGSAVPQLQYDSVGLPVPPIPAPVRIVRGKDPMTWTDAERNNSTVRQMFPGLRHLLPPDPGSAGTYLPTPNQPSLPVQMENGDIEWRSNPNYYSAGD